MDTEISQSSYDQNKSYSQPGESLTVGPEVLQYLNYREYLNDWFNWKKRKNPKFSGALFAKKSGFSAHTLLGMVIRGQRNLTYSSLHGFLRALELRGKKAKYFEKLVYYNQAKSPEEKENYFKEMLELSASQKNVELMELKSYNELLSSWHVVAIKEMLNFPGFRPEPSWIAKKLKGRVSKKQVEQAWQVLVDLDLIRYDDGLKKYVSTNKAIDIDPRISDFALKNYYKELLSRAVDSIENEGPDDREFSSLVISVSNKQLAELKIKINEFRKNLNKELSSSEEAAESVVVLSCQLLELTEKNVAGGNLEK